MEKTKKLTLLATVVLLAGAGTAQAGGFNIYEAGARATALGGAFTATADDGSALFYNPAGMAFFSSGTKVDLNLMPVIPDANFSGATPPTPPASGETATQFFPVPGAYFCHTLESGVGFGVGLYAPFGLGVKWEDPETWVGRETSYDVNLQTIYVTPAVAYKFDNDQVAIAVGVDIAHQSIELNKFSAIPFGGTSERFNVIDTQLKGGSKLSYSFCGGFLFKPTDKLSFGMMYHHKKTMKYEDREATLRNAVPDDEIYADLKDTIDGQIAALGGTENTINAEVNLPDIFSLGARYQVLPKLAVEVDAVHFGWSTFDEVSFTFGNDPTGMLSTTIEESYEDVWQFRLGLDYDLRDNLKAMFGYVRDKSPQPVESMGPMLPDADRNDLSCGLQLQHNAWRFTASYMAVFNRARSTVVDGEVATFREADAEEVATRTREAGTYDSFANIFGIGIGRSF